MIDFIMKHQLDLMLLLCGSCGILIFLLLITGSLPKSRKKILILMELIALFLLWFDRQSYIFSGDPGRLAYIMVRVSNFMVFFLTSGIVFGLNLYIIDYLTHEGKLDGAPRRLTAVAAISVAGMFMSVFAAFTDLYYYFDEANKYYRGRGFLLAYIVPVVGPLIQFTVIRQYRKLFSRLIYISLVLYIFVPITFGFFQIFFYGVSIVNISLVAVSLSLYILSYIDLNNTVEHAYEKEIRNMHRLFDQTATAFVSAVEKRDELTVGTSVRTAEYAKKIAQESGKDEAFCEKVYYSALLHDIGMIGVPDSVIKSEGELGRIDDEWIRKKPAMGKEILSSITEYPYLGETAYYCMEKYNGKGFPEGLKGKDIPEIARIVAVANAYVSMTTRKRYRDARPGFVAREAFVKGAGEEFDPVFSDIMVKIIDSEGSREIREDVSQVENELCCDEYRKTVSKGIPVEDRIKHIRFECKNTLDREEGFSAPSIILFDSFDRRVHSDKKTIREYHYLEYGEIWFDEHMISTAARKTEVTKLIRDEGDDGGKSGKPSVYEIFAGRFEDHLKISMSGGGIKKEMIIALPDSTKSAYIGLTGEHCTLSGISVEPTGETVGAGDIPRIADPVSYIDHLESDIKNIQVDRTRSVSTEGIELKYRHNVVFHTMSLPGADLVWHCPYVVIFYSDDGRVDGDNYVEYALIKMNGESNGSGDTAMNRFSMKKTEDFPGWEAWKAANKEGLDCEISVEKKGNRIILRTENQGVRIENITNILEDHGKVYLALTGDQVALTDICLM